MSQGLYERYKDALRRGHVAALRGRLDVAEAAYRAAATIAPDRALPYASLGSVLGRLQRPDEALVAYAMALSLVPGDEAALRGRAELQADLGRRAEAANDFETLAGVLERADRLTDAADAARRALELAESRTRRREMERLGRLLRDSGADQSAVDALDRALRILEAVETPAGAEAEAEAAGASAQSPGGSAGPMPGTEAAAGDRAAVEPSPDEPAPEPPPEPPPPDPAVLRAVADALLDSGDVAGAAERLLALAALHRAAGRHDAAMDACLALLAVTPADHRLQREIAAIQVEWGWTGVASEKLHLLARLADLDGDTEARAAIADFAAERGLKAPPGSAGPA
jgi:tetratricopeptide (TPR) repeat protein